MREHFGELERLARTAGEDLRAQQNGDQGETEAIRDLVAFLSWDKPPPLKEQEQHPEVWFGPRLHQRMIHAYLGHGDHAKGWQTLQDEYLDVFRRVRDYMPHTLSQAQGCCITLMLIAQRAQAYKPIREC